MILCKPEKVYFENQEDVIDYVAKGLPPVKKNFDRFIDRIGEDKKVEGEPYIPAAILDMDEEDLKDVLHRVYEDNRRNYMIGGIICGALFLGIAGALVFGGGKEEPKEEVTVYEI